MAKFVTETKKEKTVDSKSFDQAGKTRKMIFVLNIN